MIKTPEEGRENYKDAVRIHRRTMRERESLLKPSDYSKGGFKAPATLQAKQHEEMKTRSQEKLRYMAIALALTVVEISRIEAELDDEEQAEQPKISPTAGEYGGICG